MKNFRLFLAVVLLVGTPALAGAAGFGSHGDGTAVPMFSNSLTELALLLGTGNFASGPRCETEGLQQGFVSGKTTILDDLATNIIICNMTTCECYDCQSGNCVPVPPPRWCAAP